MMVLLWILDLLIMNLLIMLYHILFRKGLGLPYLQLVLNPLSEYVRASCRSALARYAVGWQAIF